MTTYERPANRPHPVQLRGSLDPHLSRGLWLVKWMLAIPHVLVLIPLWIAFALSTGVAFVAILVTGRYPRSMFDFNVGVMRWTWRVSFYAFGAIASDEYPPFSLQPRNYPADLSIAYPEQLSRGLVLVKWWLLAIPHYLVLWLLTGDASEETTGLIGILVLIAGVALLFTGRYPRGLFDLVMGLQRWVYRVWAYVALMTDEYPPFRLDMGGDEPPVPADAPLTNPAPIAPAHS